MFKRYDRADKRTGAIESYISSPATLSAVSAEKTNSKGKPYYSFNAKVEASSGTQLVAGKVYKALIPFLGSMPKIGDAVTINALEADLRAGHNSYWNLGGSNVDSVDSILADLPPE